MTSYGGTTIHATLADIERHDTKSDESQEVKVSLMDADISQTNALKLLKKFETNANKNSNEIVDGIIDREAMGHGPLYKEYRYDRQGLVKRKELNKFDLDRQRQRIIDIYKKVEGESAAKKDFEDGLYFKYVRMNENSDKLDKKSLHRAKLGGRFAVNIAQKYESPVRIRAFANDNLAFYIHKNGHFMQKLSKSPTRKEAKKKKDDEVLQSIKTKYTHLEEELQMKREAKREEYLNKMRAQSHSQMHHEKARQGLSPSISNSMISLPGSRIIADAQSVDFGTVGQQQRLMERNLSVPNLGNEDGMVNLGQADEEGSIQN